MSDRYAVVGNPVEHSLSPAIHSDFARQTGQDLEYTKIQTTEDEFEQTVEGFFAGGGRGLNITAPFKNLAHGWVAQVDSSAVESSAVNTIVWSNGMSTGFNTDGLGLEMDFRRLNWDLADARVLVLGGGGAAQGILALLIRQAASVTVANRSGSRLEAVQNRFAGISTTSLHNVCGNWDVVVNATSAYRNGQSLEVDAGIFSGALCYDLTYASDGRTPFVAHAEESGARRAQDGLGMLVFQGAAAFKLWRNVEPSAEETLKRIRTA